jgi:cytochrome c5
MNAKIFTRTAILTAVTGLSLSVSSVTFAAAGDDEGANSRIAPVAKVKLANVPAAGGGQPRTGEALYNAACMACHATGAAGAPKIGDNAAWAPRLALGLNGLVKSAIAGKNAMPPKGGSDATDVELARAIAYMANKSGGKFAEPK